MSPLVALSTPCLLWAFLVMRVMVQSFSSALPSTTSLGKVSNTWLAVKQIVPECLESGLRRFTYNGLEQPLQPGGC